MKKQIIIIHGGTTFDTYEEYIAFLKNRDVNAEKFKTKRDWKGLLETELSTDYEVFSPRMPNGANARYEEWKIWFERMIPFLENGGIFVGHSLGGIFLAKYFSENIFPKKIAAVFLVAAPFNGVGGEESLTDFILPQSLEKFAAQTPVIYLMYSKDDPVVPIDECRKYTEKLPQARIIPFSDKQHFNQDSFPEIVELLRSI